MNLTVKEAAKLLNTTENKIYRLISDEHLPAYRVEDKYRLNRVELLEWATSRGMKVSPEIFRGNEEPVPSELLAQSLQRGGQIADLDAPDKRAVLRAVCDRIVLPAGVNRDDLYSVLLARETLGSTAIGNGIAIPHPRGPIIMGVQDPEVTLVYLRNPIDFGAVDGQPVSILFVIVSPSVRYHLNLLSHLMYALQDADFQALLAARASAEQIVKQVVAVETRLAGGGAKGAAT